MVLYVDSVAGGIVSTASLNATGDLLQRLATGVGLGGQRAALYFPPGFRADRIICLGPASAMVYAIRGSSLLPINGALLGAATDLAGGTDVVYRVDDGAQGGRVREFQAPLSYLNVAPLGAFRLLATLLDGDVAYRSNEFVGVAPGNWWDSENPGQNNVVLKHGDFVSFQASPALGDLDADGAVTAADFAVLAAALAGPGVTTPPPHCNTIDFANADLDGDRDVDLADCADFQRRMTVGE